MNTFIYALCEPGTRTVRYIGKTKDLKARLQQHLRESSTTRSTHLGHWLKTIREAGAKPELICLSEVSGDSGSDEEIRYIAAAKFLGLRLTNSTDGGEGVTPTPETRQKMRDRWKLRTPVSDETRRKMSLAHKGRAKTPEERAKLSASLKGRSPSEACLRQSVLARRERGISAETRAKMSASGRGRVFTDLHRANLSAAGQGRPVSPETRAKIGASRKAHFSHKKGGR